jgi:hypothetical protein
MRACTVSFLCNSFVQADDGRSETTAHDLHLKVSMCSMYINDALQDLSKAC